MPLTPLDIHNKEFKKSFRGYDEVEVDEFLDQIIDSYESLFKENVNLKETLAAKDSNISHYKDLEDTLKQTLVVAQQTADEIRNNSEKQAKVLIQEAEVRASRLLVEAEEKARQIVAGAEKKATKATKDAEDLRKHLQVFRVKFKSFLEGQLALIDDKNEIFNHIDAVNPLRVDTYQAGNGLFASALEAAATETVAKEPVEPTPNLNETVQTEAQPIETSRQIINKEVIF